MYNRELEDKSQFEKLKIYCVPNCPFCSVVFNVIEEIGLDYEKNIVKKERKELRELTGGSTQVPVLVDPNQDNFEWMNESEDIVDYIEYTYNND